MKVTYFHRPANPDCVDSWVGTIWEGDCVALMEQMPAQCVDLVLADLPYGTTRNKWDSVIPLEQLWRAYRRVLKPTGCVVLTAAQPFTSALVMSNPDWFKYEWVWSKTVGSGQLNTGHQPLRTHESVLVFAPGKPRYNALMEEGSPYTAVRKADRWQGRGYNRQSSHTAENSGVRHPKSVLAVPNPRIKGGHPTQKPLELFTYLIRTYTDPGDVVLDNVMGSATTAEAAIRLGRRFVGMEQDPEFVRVGTDRVTQVVAAQDAASRGVHSQALRDVLAYFEQFTAGFLAQQLTDAQRRDWLAQADKYLPGSPVLFAFAEMSGEEDPDAPTCVELTVITASRTVRLSTVCPGPEDSVQVCEEEQVPTAQLQVAAVKRPGVRATVTLPSGTRLDVPVQMRHRVPAAVNSWGSVDKVAQVVSQAATPEG